MAYYLSKYKGQYRLRTDVDPATGDFYREKIYNKETKEYTYGEYLHNDIYIYCSYGRIYHYGGNVLGCWVGDITNQGINKIQKFNNMVKKHKKIIIPDSVISGDKEGSFHFKDCDLAIIAKDMGGIFVTCVDRSPTSSKNLEKDEYEIPSNDLEDFSLLVEKIGLKMQHYNKMYKIFGDSIDIDIASMAKLEKLKAKEYIHKNGHWEKLLEFMSSYEL